MEHIVKWFKTLTCDDDKRPHPRRAVENCDDDQLFHEEMAGFDKDTSVENGQDSDAAVMMGGHTTNIPNRNQSVVQLLKKKDVDFQEVLRLIREGQNVNAKDKLQNSVLHLAIQKINNENRNHIAFIENLLAAGADVQARNTGGNTPFMLAAEKNKYRVLQILASHDKNEINAKNSKGETALHLAVGKKQRQSVSMLHRFAATNGLKENITAKSTGMTALQLATSGPLIDQEIVDILKSNPSQYNLEVTKDERYKMDAIPRGKCLIIQNEDFKETPGLSSAESSRSGCRDADLIADTFARLHFEIIEPVLKNRKGHQMYKDILDFSEDLRGYDCIIVCISSHGCSGCIQGTDWGMLHITDVLQLFSKEELAGIPKLFFFNACRSRLCPQQKGVSEECRARQDAGVSEEEPTDLLLSSMDGNDASDPRQHERAKAMRDIFIGYSSSDGHASFRMEHSSSYYFEQLCRTLDDYGTSKEFQRIMTIVNQRVWEASSLQVPSPVNMLFKELWFAPQRS